MLCKGKDTHNHNVKFMHADTTTESYSSKYKHCKSEICIDACFIFNDTQLKGQQNVVVCNSTFSHSFVSVILLSLK
jgi:hypothetical protein